MTKISPELQHEIAITEQINPMADASRSPEECLHIIDEMKLILEEVVESNPTDRNKVLRKRFYQICPTGEEISQGLS